MKRFGEFIGQRIALRQLAGSSAFRFLCFLPQTRYLLQHCPSLAHRAIVRDSPTSTFLRKDRPMTEAGVKEAAGFAPGTFCWVELATSDTARAKEFYTKL